MPENSKVSMLIDKIIGHKKLEESGEIEYLVKWKSKEDYSNDFVKASDFDDVSPIHTHSL